MVFCVFFPLIFISFHYMWERHLLDWCDSVWVSVCFCYAHNLCCVLWCVSVSASVCTICMSASCEEKQVTTFFDLTLTQDVDSGVRAECWHQKTICHMKQSLFNQYQHFFCFASKSHAEKVNVFSGCSSCKRRYNCFTFRGLIFLREFLKIPHLFVLFCTKCGLICLGLATMLSSLHSLLTQQPCTPPSHSSSCLWV